MQGSIKKNIVFLQSTANTDPFLHVRAHAYA